VERAQSYSAPSTGNRVTNIWRKSQRRRVRVQELGSILFTTVKASMSALETLTFQETKPANLIREVSAQHGKAGRN
jgi:hypothetical protein